MQADLTQTEWKTFADGYVSAILRLQHFYPEAQIISILPTINTKYYNNATLEQYNSVMRAICMHYAVEYVDLVAEGYTTNLLGDATHPNAAGMDFITNAVKKVITNPHTHNYTAVVTAPTCAEQGYTTHTCSCGETYRDNFVDATGNHSYENGVCVHCGTWEENTIVITKQPVSDYALIGEKATIFVEAQGDGPSYQWYYRDLPSGSLTKSTITKSVYTLTVKASNVNRELYCVITDAHGNKVTTETVKLLQPLNPKLEIIRQPSPAYAAIGEKASVFVEAQGDGLSYQWYYRDSAKGVLYKSSITSSNYCITVTKANIQRVLYCVITDAHGNKITTETVKLVGDPADPNRPVYYTSLNDALKGEAGSNSPEGAVVEVLQENGETIIRLLQDAVLTEALTIANKITLDLNKYTIHSTASPAISVEADRVTIRGGNISLTASGAGTSNSPSVAVLANSGSILEMYDVMVTAIDTENGTVVGVMGKENSELKITGSTVIVTAETSLMNVGVHAYGPATLTDCTVIAESNYTGNKAGTAYASHAYGIYAEKDLTLKNCYVWGPHSGVCAKGKTLVDGGTYEGYGHGAFYFAGSNTTAYVYNASVNWAEMREGTYADTIAGTNGAGMYVGGGAKNVSVYMDNCQIYGTLYGIVLRNSGGETNNSIYISNSTFTGCQSYAYRNGHNANNGTLRVYAGVGVNYSAITGKISKFPNYYYETDESYAQNVAG